MVPWVVPSTYEHPQADDAPTRHKMCVLVRVLTLTVCSSPAQSCPCTDVQLPQRGTWDDNDVGCESTPHMCRPAAVPLGTDGRLIPFCFLFRLFCSFSAKSRVVESGSQQEHDAATNAASQLKPKMSTLRCSSCLYPEKEIAQSSEGEGEQRLAFLRYNFKWIWSDRNPSQESEYVRAPVLPPTAGQQPQVQGFEPRCIHSGFMQSLRGQASSGRVFIFWVECGEERCRLP